MNDEMREKMLAKIQEVKTVDGVTANFLPNPTDPLHYQENVVRLNARLTALEFWFAQAVRLISDELDNKK